LPDANSNNLKSNQKQEKPVYKMKMKDN